MRNANDESRLIGEVEPLERRQLLAGSVTATITGAGNLVVNGDGGDNNIDVIIASDGTVTVNGNDGEVIDDSGLVGAVVTGNVTVKLKGGYDQLTLYGDGSTTVKNIKVVGGSQTDYITLNYINADGNVVVNSGRDKYDTAGLYNVNVAKNVTISSGVSVFGDVNADNVKIKSDGVMIDNLNAQGDLKISTGGGFGDAVDINSSQISGTLALNMGGNVGGYGDTAYLQDSSFGFAKLNMGGGSYDLLSLYNVTAGGGSANGGGGAYDYFNSYNSSFLTVSGFEYYDGGAMA